MSVGEWTCVLVRVHRTLSRAAAANDVRRGGAAGDARSGFGGRREVAGGARPSDEYAGWVAHGRAGGVKNA